MTLLALLLIGWIALNVALVAILYAGNQRDTRARARRFLLR